jgi:O-methyltransferase involved in polyketide biosynthesis
VAGTGLLVAAIRARETRREGALFRDPRGYFVVATK